MAETEYDYDVLAIRRRLGPKTWGPPQVGPGPWGVTFTSRSLSLAVIVSSFPEDDGVDWLHASIAPLQNTEPPVEYEILATLRYAVWGLDGWAFQVFAPPSDHINIRANALHLWGRLDGKPTHPNFGRYGTI